MGFPRLGRGRAAALIAVAALLWQTLLPLLPAPRGAASDLVAICTEHGLRMVSVAGGNSPNIPAPDNPGKVDCPLCASMHLAGACLPGSIAALPVAMPRTWVFADIEHAVSTAGYRNQLARAPPVIA